MCSYLLWFYLRIVTYSWQRSCFFRLSRLSDLTVLLMHRLWWSHAVGCNVTEKQELIWWYIYICHMLWLVLLRVSLLAHQKFRCFKSRMIFDVGWCQAEQPTGLIIDLAVSSRLLSQACVFTSPGILMTAQPSHPNKKICRCHRYQINIHTAHVILISHYKYMSWLSCLEVEGTRVACQLGEATVQVGISAFVSVEPMDIYHQLTFSWEVCGNKTWFLWCDAGITLVA